jgi:mono/diheme cytochrome c family protein
MRLIPSCLAVAVAAAVTLLGAGVAFSVEPAAGHQVFLKAKCNSCHTLKAEKIEKKKVEPAEEEEAAATATGTKKEPPDLSGVGIKRDATWIENWLARKELIDGKKHKKRFTGTPAEMKTVSAWLATMKTKIEPAKPVAK